MRLALIGVGQVARHQLAAMARTHGIRLVDALELDPGKFGVLGNSVRFHPNLNALLEHSDADLFIVSTPSNTHLDISRHLLENGRAVLIEKPACANAAELDTLAALADATGMFVSVALHAGFGLEVQWWLEHRDDSEFDLGELISFDSGCFDPYIMRGEIGPQARTLLGSWLDSGINALSVVGTFIDTRDLTVYESFLAMAPGYEDLDVRGKATFTFSGKKAKGHGCIETNWTLGLDRKVTRLTYEGGDIILHHSKESVFLCREGKKILLKDLRNRFPRLTNHYCGLFAEVRNQLRTSQGNLESAIPLHRLLFEVLEKGQGYNLRVRSCS
jgi:predicted dehydrogenase